MTRYMRFIMLLALLAADYMTANATSLAFRAGVVRISVSDTEPLEAVVWYPTDAPEVPWQAGPFTVSASLGAPIAGGQKFPVILLSHGRNGGPLSHRDLAAGLARNGFVVVVPTHAGDAAGYPKHNQSRILKDRPRQAIAALHAALRDSRLAEHVNPQRVGMIGYSAGGYTALVLAGARPDFGHAEAYCRENAGDIGTCAPMQEGGTDLTTELENWQPPSEPRLKALVLMDPWAAMFDKAGLSEVHIPTLLFRPENDIYMGAQPNASAIAAGLPDAPRQVIMPGTHFVFINPCPDIIATEAALICKDGPGIDRAAIHGRIEEQTVQFLRQAL